MSQKRFLLFIVLIVGVYFTTHLVGLTKLPVFVDEAIYIRWAQLIMDDGRRYLFFPLNDGKTPLFIWSLVPFQYLFANQLMAGRLVSVLVGLGQVFALGWLLKSFRLKRTAVLIGMLSVVLLPFWYFHHRMALMDGMLSLWLTLALIGVIHLLKKVDQLWLDWGCKAGLSLMLKLGLRQWLTWFWLVVAGLAVGAAFWTKLPAALFLPGLFIWPFWFVDLRWSRKTAKRLLFYWFFILLSVLLGLLLFFSLKTQPVFHQLFGRGGDFLFSLDQLIHQGGLLTALKRWPSYLQALSYYLGPFVLLSPLVGLVMKRHRKLQLLLFLATLMFLLPIFVLGKVVYPRYFLPAAIFLTTSYAVLLADVIDWILETRQLQKKAVLALALAIILANTITPSLYFLSQSMTNPNQIPFVKVDQVQYLSSWSAGNGVQEVAAKLLREKSATNRIALATEGYFGTLPDGLLMYLHGKDVSNLMVEGIGQPVVSLPAEFVSKAKKYDQVWLLVNSNRLKMKLAKDKRLARFCRLPDPYDLKIKCLELYDLTDLVFSR